MLEALRRSQRWFMTGVILLVAGIFVFYLGVGRGGRGPSGGYVVELGHRRYSLQDLQRVRDGQEQRLRQSLGDAFDPTVAGAYLDQAAAEQIIQRAVLAAEAQRLGLAASDREIRDLVRQNSGFLDDTGRLDADRIRNYAQAVYGGERRFADEVRDDILLTKLLRVIDASVDVSDAEARDSLRNRLEEVKIAYVALDPEKLGSQVEVSDEAVVALLAEQPDRAHRFYDEHSDRYHVPERVRARHILIKVDPAASDQDVAAARQRAQAALDRVRAGEDFAAVAQELSEDPGSREKGGDLGFFPRGQMTPAFEDAAFSLGVGETSDLVRSDFGFHVIRVEEHAQPVDHSFDEVAREIAETLVRQDRAKALEHEIGERLAAAVREGASLTDAARAEGLTLERTDWLKRRPDGYVEGLGSAPVVLVEAFALPDDPASSPRLFEVGDKLVLIERLEHRGPTDDELDAQLPGERDRLLAARRNEAQMLWIQSARTRLAQSGALRVDLSALQGS
jgi:peptidyl-prolyl cis-trans isomerase D